MANKERVRLNISVIQCLFLLSKVQCICLARMFLNMTLYLSVTMTKISYTKRFRLLGKMEHLCGYIMRLYGDLNCVIKEPTLYEIKNRATMMYVRFRVTSCLYL